MKTSTMLNTIIVSFVFSCSYVNAESFSADDKSFNIKSIVKTSKGTRTKERKSINYSNTLQVNSISNNQPSLLTRRGTRVNLNSLPSTGAGLSNVVNTRNTKGSRGSRGKAC